MYSPKRPKFPIVGQITFAIDSKYQFKMEKNGYALNIIYETLVPFKCILFFTCPGDDRGRRGLQACANEGREGGRKNRRLLCPWRLITLSFNLITTFLRSKAQPSMISRLISEERGPGMGFKLVFL